MPVQTRRRRTAPMSAAARIGGGGHGRRGKLVGALLPSPPPVACPLSSVFFSGHKSP